MTEITKAEALRIAAKHMGWKVDDSWHGAAANALREEADRLDRAAADDAEIEEAAKVAFAVTYELGHWDSYTAEHKDYWIRLARALRDHFRKPRTGQDAQFIAGQITWWINANGKAIYEPLPAALSKRTDFIDGLGRFVLDLVDGAA